MSHLDGVGRGFGVGEEGLGVGEDRELGQGVNEALNVAQAKSLESARDRPVACESEPSA